MRWLRWLLLAVGLLAVVGVGAMVVLSARGARSCTMAGCVSATSFNAVDMNATYGPGRTATFCVDDECTTVPWEVPTFLSVPDVLGDPGPTEHDPGATVRRASLSIELADANVGRWEWTGEAESAKSQPNGPRCEPTCYFLAFTIREDALVPVDA